MLKVKFKPTIGLIEKNLFSPGGNCLFSEIVYSKIKGGSSTFNTNFIGVNILYI